MAGEASPVEKKEKDLVVLIDWVADNGWTHYLCLAIYQLISNYND